MAGYFSICSVGMHRILGTTTIVSLLLIILNCSAKVEPCAFSLKANVRVMVT